MSSSVVAATPIGTTILVFSFRPSRRMDSSTTTRWSIAKLQVHTWNFTKIKMIYIFLSSVLKNKRRTLLEAQNEATGCVLFEVRSEN
jgi:hypothetical protein